MDEELSGAAAALLGLHARNSDKPTATAAPIAPAPRPAPVSLPGDQDQSHSRYGQWSRSQISASSSYEPKAPAENGNSRRRTHAATPEDSPPSNPYPFYPAPTLGKPASAAAAPPPYAEQQRGAESGQVGGYFESSPVVSTRRDFLASSGGRGGWAQRQQQQQQQPISTNPASIPPPPPQPRRRTEWTPRFGPPHVTDPRAVLDVRHAAAVDAWAFLQQQQQQQQQQPQQQKQRTGISPTVLTSPPSPSLHVGPGAREQFPGYLQSVETNAAPHHVIRDRFRGDCAPVAAALAGPGLPGRFAPREYE
ncbi:unnamed protein product, partial [Scytosiphon promiscuus]